MKSLAFAALAIWGVAAAAAGAAEPKVVNPDWVRQPTQQEIWWAYPPEALKKHIEGRAQISCSVDANGDAQLCVIQSEDPPGMGFGQAAVSLRATMKFRPKTVDGKYVPGDVQIPIRFSTEGMLSADAPAVTLTPRQSQLAARLVAALDLEEASNRIFEEGLQRSLYFTASFDSEERRIVSEAVRAALAKTRPRLSGAIASDLVIGLSDDELEKAVAYFETPGGKKVAHRVWMAEIRDRPATQALVVAVVQDARDSICRRNAAACRKIEIQTLGVPERK